MNAWADPDPGPGGQAYQDLKNLYTQVRKAAINEWARLPEKSSLRIVFGKFIFILLPPADRTIPWTVVEEVAYALLLMVSAGLGGLITGTYLPMYSSVAAYYYLQVIAPVPPGQAGAGAGAGISVGGS